MNLKLKYVILIMALALAGCEADNEGKSKQIQQKAEVIPPAFSGDSAYQFVQDQVDFGPRVPNTDAHAACAEYLVKKLESYGGEVMVQEAQVTAYDGTRLDMKNIIGQFSPEKKRRILLFAHWDTRPWADKDSLESRWREPIDGANDGGSGVAVLLEIARLIQQQEPDHGIDIILFDAEDYGTPEFSDLESDSRTWCLGSQYWSENQHKEDYRAKFGILLDMVGSNTATFPKEGTSMHFAPQVVDKLWKAAKKTSNGKYFNSEVTGYTTDDHSFVNGIAGIPSACLVEYHPPTQLMGFGRYGNFHHTHKDNMAIISKETLQSVGETVAWVIYNE